MENAKPYFDLCIQDKCYLSKDFSQTAKKLIEFGYRTIAINQTINDESLESNKKKKKGESRDVNEIVPIPISVKSKTYEDLTILNRLTVTFSDKVTIHKVMQSENLKKYHIFAVIPKSNEAFQFACDSVDCDLISFEPADGKLVKLNRKMYKKALERGLFFEIMYYPAIQDATLRRNIITRSHLYYQFGKSRNVILSSWTNHHLGLRNPYDIINLGLLFGLSEEKSKCAIKTNCKNLINRAEGRRMGKALIVVKTVEAESDESMEVDSDEPAQKKTKVNIDDSVIIMED